MVGAGVMALASKELGMPLAVTQIATVYGFVMGTWPDTWDWISAQMGKTERWYLYGIYHNHPPWYLIIQPPFFLHWAIDKAFHDPSKPGWNWWPQLGWLEITMWYLGAILLWLAYA